MGNARRHVQSQARWQRRDAALQKERQVRLERAEENRQLRDASTERRLDELCGQSNAAQTVKQMLDEVDARHKALCRNAHAAWEADMYSPQAARAQRHMNSVGAVPTQGAAIVSEEQVCSI